MKRFLIVLSVILSLHGILSLPHGESCKFLCFVGFLSEKNVFFVVLK